MPYTTAQAVVDLIKMEEDEVAEIELIRDIEDHFAVYIEAANSIIEDVCLDSDYSDIKLELIERYLSAHFYKVLDPDGKTEMVRGLSQTVEGKTAMAFDFTRWGQQAKLLDTAGNLAQLQEEQESGKPRIRAGGWWVGGANPRGEEEIDEVG